MFYRSVFKIPEDNTSSAKGENSNIAFSFELKKEQGNRGNLRVAICNW